MSLHSSSSVNGEGSTPKEPLYKILDELRSLKLWKEKQERKEKGKKSGRNNSRWKRENKRGRKKKNNERNEKRKKYLHMAT